MAGWIFMWSMMEHFKSYLPRISMGWWLCSVLVLGIAVVWNCNQVKKKEKNVGVACFSVLITLYFFAVIMITFGTRLPDPHISFQLVPFLSYKQAIMDGSENDAFQILCNILLFVPFGVMFPFLLKNKRTESVLQVVIYAFCFTFGIEFLQLITRIGCFEIDDMINNVLGAVIGYLALCIIRRIKRICLRMFNGKTTEN